MKLKVYNYLLQIFKVKFPQLQMIEHNKKNIPLGIFDVVQLMDTYNTTITATLKLRFKGSRHILPREAVIEEIRIVIPVKELTAIYKCGDGRD